MNVRRYIAPVAVAALAAGISYAGPTGWRLTPEWPWAHADAAGDEVTG